ncbi:hypothetical protein [Antarcticirhabdus aurantiaca]|uniref:Uncharacterized protein n=1 Tax=Antarcticirhabdus aurantiaca TaxID=2606717 RepID=A0ACD4NU71_9HYPH|nr:hypothetical protein [Antarcticirhabdus aurantiaca]WAJ30266.1 hypothetical protein OXU80_08695 [Jeongeuplla avenae]
MKVFIPRKVAGAEARIAASPDTVKKLIGAGAEVLVESGPRLGSRATDKASAGDTVEVCPARTIGHLNVPGRIAASASLLHAKDLLAFLETPIDKDATSPKVDFEDPRLKVMRLTRNGSIAHPSFAPAPTRAEGVA